MEMGLAGNWFRRFLSLVEYLSGYIQALLEDLLPRRRGSWIFQRIESDSWSFRGTIQLVYLHVSPSRRRKFIQHFETRWGELYKSAIDRVRILARVLFSKHYCISPVQVKFYLPRNTNFLSFPANEIFRYVPTYFHHFFYPSFLPFFLEENRIWIFIDGARENSVSQKRTSIYSPNKYRTRQNYYTTLITIERKNERTQNPLSLRQHLVSTNSL